MDKDKFEFVDVAVPSHAVTEQIGITGVVPRVKVAGKRRQRARRALATTTHRIRVRPDIMAAARLIVADETNPYTRIEIRSASEVVVR